ncbi:HipA domain-containing protein [Roseivirga sp. BDSF3-8]|uniref:HipA domain-containing protein n=1 Tax=Roseivirga sp. BDSF3-8 TaxID=3241598 RepID=UPI003531CB46
MHLKNFSLFKNPEQGYVFSPAYDLVASALVVEGDDEELALTLNGKKKKLKLSDFQNAMSSSGLNTKVIENIFKRFQRVLPEWHDFINISFLPENLKENYHAVLDNRFRQINL